MKNAHNPLKPIQNVLLNFKHSFQLQYHPSIFENIHAEAKKRPWKPMAAKGRQV